MDFSSDNKRKPLSMFSQSSLTDIIFLLLIFFLLTSSFVSDHGIMVNITQPQSSVTIEEYQVSMSITFEGIFLVEGEQVARDGLADAIRLAYQNKPNSTLVVRADRDARVDDAVQAMNIGKALNMNIVMATERD